MRDRDWAVLLLVGVSSLILYMQPKEVHASSSGISQQGSHEALAQALKDTAPANSNT